MEEASKRSRVCNLPHSLKLSSKCKKREKRDRDEDAKRAAATFPLLLSECLFCYFPAQEASVSRFIKLRRA